jgi:hypothetical protein
MHAYTPSSCLGHHLDMSHTYIDTCTKTHTYIRCIHTLLMPGSPSGHVSSSSGSGKSHWCCSSTVTCMCICVCIVYIYMYTYIPHMLLVNCHMNVHLCLYRLYIHVHMCIYMSARQLPHACASVFVSSIYTCTHVHIHVPLMLLVSCHMHVHLSFKLHACFILVITNRIFAISSSYKTTSCCSSTVTCVCICVCIVYIYMYTCAYTCPTHAARQLSHARVSVFV